MTVVDDFSRESVQIAVDFGMGAGYVTCLLDEAATFRGSTDGRKAGGNSWFRFGRRHRCLLVGLKAKRAVICHATLTRDKG